MLPLDEAQKQAHQVAVEHGWWEGERNIGEQISNMHAELTEAWEEIRNRHAPDEIYYGSDSKKPEGFGVELADCVIRILDTCQAYGINLEEILMEKMAYNKTRPYRHGGKTA